MPQSNHRTGRIIRNAAVGILLTGVAIASALELVGTSAYSSHLDEVQQRVDQHALDLQEQTTNGTAMGAVALLGLTDAATKRVGGGGAVVDDSDPAVETLHVVRERFDAEAAFLVSRDGTIVAYATKGKSALGKNVAWRSYFAQAITGHTNVYAATSFDSGKRGIFFAAPIYAGTSVESEVIGVAVLKLTLQPIDAFLSRLEFPAVLLSPQRVAFAATDNEWRNCIAGEFTDERREALSASRQFGLLFEEAAPAPLPFALSEETFEHEGQMRAIVSAPLRWRDPGGAWTLVFLPDSSEWFPIEHQIVIVASILVSAALLVALLRLFQARRRIARQAVQARIDAERQEVEKQREVLYSTLPQRVADRVVRGETVNDHHDDAAVLFLDIVGFTAMASTRPAASVVETLEVVFSACDRISQRHGLTTIKTIGDAYLAVAGIGDDGDDVKAPITRVAHAALDMIEAIRSAATQDDLDARVGLSAGPLVAGVLGLQRRQFDVWGDTVNVASRMESSGVSGRVQITGSAAETLSATPSNLRVIERGVVDVRGKGETRTCWVERVPTSSAA